MADPLSTLTDEQLFNSQLSLVLACGRSHSSLKQKHRQYFCILFETLKIESNNRGKSAPQWPYKA